MRIDTERTVGEPPGGMIDSDRIVTVPIGRLVEAVGLALGALGVVHLAAPKVWLDTARWGYERVLDVEFRPQGRAQRRVRAVGAAMLAAGALALALTRGRADGNRGERAPGVTG